MPETTSTGTSSSPSYWIALGVSTNSAAMTRLRARQPTSSMRAPAVRRAQTSHPGPVKETDVDSSAHVHHATGKATRPKDAAAHTTAANDLSAPTGAMTRWTSVPLYRSNPMIPAAQVVVVHIPTTPPRTQPCVGVIPPQAEAARNCTSVVDVVVMTMSWMK